MSSNPISEPDLPALRRVGDFASLDEQDIALLRSCAQSPKYVQARRDLPANLFAARGAVLILDGWAHRSCLLADGRRQITGLLLPGEIVASSSIAGSVDSTVTAITPVNCCWLPENTVATRPNLAQALDGMRAMEEQSLRRQIVRLGRLDALERIADWLLEIYERLEASGSCIGDTMPLPVTQETIADVLGLTSVHVNRVLGVLRRENVLTVQGGRVIFLDRERCRSIAVRR